ncbi:MAG: hypothetical protein ABI554_12470, partial [Flavobacterium sp.]
RELFKDKIEYKPIVDFLLAKDYLDDDLNIPFPKMKDVEEGTGIKSYTLRKILLKMHSEIFSYDTNRLNLKFNNVLYHFYIRFFDYRCDFTISKISHLPRIGENIRLPFVSATMPLTSFYVENIMYEFENDTQNVTITLKVGDYNEYWKFMYDRALELNEIGIMEKYNLSETELKNKIYSKNPYR